MDIDDIIDKFKAKIYDVNTVKDKLMGIIHKVTGEKE